jgi:ribosomal protein S18 acetylase RimI-like enzyme
MTAAGPGFEIVLLDHRDAAVAHHIHAVLLPAYAQEARLLQAQDFPPMQRSAEDIQADDAIYLGAQRNGTLLGAVALARDGEPGQLLITTLVVHPAHQRQGVARALMTALLARGAGMAFGVATGARNAPALALYQALGFEIYRHGTVGPDALPLVKLRRPATALAA